MRSKYILIAVSVVAAMAAVVVAVSAGNPDSPPGPPGSTFSYTVEHIYQRLLSGAAGTPISFTEPISGPAFGTGHTLDEIMASESRYLDAYAKNPLWTDVRYFFMAFWNIAFKHARSN